MNIFQMSRQIRLLWSVTLWSRPLSLIKQFNIPSFCVKNVFSSDDDIPTFTRLRSEAVDVPINLNNILG